MNIYKPNGLWSKLNVIKNSTYTPSRKIGNDNDIVIPKKIFLTYAKQQLLPNMLNNINNLVKKHPDFEIVFMDDRGCLNFIKTFFSTEVVHAFQILIPGAYKADLWRYCVMYIHGGIYMDIKYTCAPNFLLNELLYSEHFTLDRPGYWYDPVNFGLFNGLMVCKPKNEIMLKCIQRATHNILNRKYCQNALYPTGPGLLAEIFAENNGNWDTVDLCGADNGVILFKNTIILSTYKEYRNEHQRMTGDSYYILYKKQHIYNNMHIWYLSDGKYDNLSKIINTDNNTPEIETQRDVPTDKTDTNETNETSETSETNNTTDTSEIPNNLFIHWSSENIPPKMAETLQQVIDANPEMKIHIFYDEICRSFIEEYYDENILNTYDRLIPSAYKSDLWRLCILYKYGGIYMDIKFGCVNNFKLCSLLDKEHFALDKQSSVQYSLVNGFMVVKPNNELLFECIKQIVRNSYNGYYSLSSLYPTGPGLLGLTHYNMGLSGENIDMALLHNGDGNIPVQIIYKNKVIIESYDSYRIEQKLYTVNKHYANLYAKNNIYKPIHLGIPKVIYQTWQTKFLPPNMKKSIQTLKLQNPNFNVVLFDDNDCKLFISRFLGQRVLNAYNKLKPGAFKADLWRYCILYVRGGVYLDIKYQCVEDFTFERVIGQTIFVREFINDNLDYNPIAIYNGFMISYPGNIIFQKCIEKICENVENLYYGTEQTGITGPIMMGELFDESYKEMIDYGYIELPGAVCIVNKWDKRAILKSYPGYHEERKWYSNKEYWKVAYKNKTVYNI